MSDTNFVIKTLMADIEKKLGRTMQTPSDFNYLVSVISQQCDESISAHTLMRVWGYLSSKSQPSVTTLSILSRFMGFMDFRHYELDYNLRIHSDSGFIMSDSITADMLQPGDELTICWNPDRKLTVAYEGNFIFIVKENENTKLEKGMEFRCTSFSKGLPFIAYIINDERGQLNYIGGKKTGISSLSISKQRRE